MRRAPHVDRERIRELFLDRQDSYTLAAAARVLGVAPGTVRREAEHDDRDAYRINGAWRFRWRQVAFLALHRWTVSQIYEALDPDAVTVLPSLLAPQPLTVHLPAYLVHAIAHAADDEQLSVDDWLHLEMVDFASGVVHRMERVLPGFRRAYLFPERE